MADPLLVLYVDDEPDLLEIGKLFLEQSEDFTVTTTMSAPEALRLLEQEKFDAIISDYQMPGMDGIQFLVEVRSRFGPIPFILFTGRGREEVVIQAINSGADFYLQKGGEPAAQFAELAHKIKAAASSKRADDALRKSEKRYRHLIEHSNEAIVVAQDGMLKLVNHRTTDFTGYREQELLSMPFSAFIHPDDRAMVVERYHKRMKGEEGPSRYAFRLSSKDGSTRWVELSVVVIDWDGRPATLNFLTDITERKRADDSLREEQQFSTLLLDSLPGIFYLYTYPENRMVRWNKQHETLLGYTAEEIKGKLGTDLHLPEYKDAVLRAIDEVMEKGQSSVESTLMAKDGRLIPFFFTGVRFETPGQLYFMGIGIDISERKRAEEALLKKTEELHASYEQLTASEEELRQNVDDLTRSSRELSESEEKFRVIADYTVNWESWFGADGTYIWVSPSVARFTGYTQAEILAMPHFISTVIAKEDQAMFTERFREAIHGISGENFEFRYLHRNGTKHWLNVSWQPIVDMNGNSFGTRVSGHDITGRKQAEEALRKSEEKFRKAFYTSHDSVCITRLSDGMFVSVNEGFTEITGYTEEDVAGKTSLEINIWKDSEDRLKIIAALKAKGEVRNYEARFLTKRGEISGLMSTSIIELNGVPHILNITHDITERKRAEEALIKNTEELHASYEELTASEEELRQNVNDLIRTEQALRESEEKFHSLYLHMTEGAVLHELTFNEQGIPEDYVIIETNPAFERQLGISRDDVIGKTSREAYGVSGPPFLEIYARVALTGKPEIFETYFPPLAKHFSISVYSPGKGRFATIFEDITERKRDGEALKESEERFRLTLDATNDGIWDWDIPTGTAFFSPRWYTMLGYAPDEMPGSYATWRSLIHPDDIGPAEQIIQDHAGRMDGDYRVEFRMRTKDGRWKWILARGQVVEWDADNKPVRMVGTHTDITERKKAEQELVSAHENLKEAHRLAHIGTWDWITETDTVTWSEELCNISGWDPSLPAPTYAELPRIYTPASWDLLNAAVTNALNTGESYNLELELIRPDGSIRWTNAFGGVQRDETGKVIGLHGTLQDITERKVAEETLAETNAYLNNLLEYANAPIIVWDPNFVITRFNHAFEDVTLIPEQEVIGQRLEILFPKESRDTSLLQIKKTLEGERWETVEIPILIKDGSVRMVLWNSANVLDTHGRIISTIAQGVDVTERKRAEAALAESSATFKTVMDSLDALVYVADMKTHEILFVNEYGRKIWGDITGKICWESLQVGQIGPCPFCTNEKLLDSDGNPTGVLIWEFRNTITGHWYECHDRAIRWTDGRIVRIEIATDITNRKQTEETLRNREEYYRMILQTTKDGFWIIDAHTGRFLDVNETYCEMSGYSKAETLDMGINDIDSVEDPAKTREHIRRILTNGSDLFETRHRRKDGSLFDLEISVTYFPAEGGKFICFCRDITRRKRVMELLVESESFNRGLVENLPDYISVYGMDGKLLYVNPASARTLGYDADTLIGTHVLSYIAEEYHETVIAKMRVRKKGDEVSPYEIEMVTRNGSRRSVIVKAAPIQYQNNPATLLLLIDISERKQAEEALRQLSDRLSLATRAGGVGIWDFDVVNNTLTWDDQMFALYGITKEQFGGAYEAWQAGLPPEDKQRCDDEVQMALRGEKEFDTEFCVLRPDGSIRNIRAFALVKRDAGGKPLRMIGTNWDITERKELEKEMKIHEQELMQFSKSLASANKKLSLLSSITRHDINNQLTVLMGFLNILQKKQPDPTLTEYFRKVSVAAQRITNMIQFTREYESIGVTAPVWQDCRNLVDTAAKQAPLGQVMVRNDLPAGAEVFADQLITKVFYNLMENAVRYGRKITTIRFSAQETGKDYLMICEDDGDGIPADEKEKIFERGFGKNTGMGLFLSQEILDITGIMIIEAGVPGKGARFEMKVPKGAWRMVGESD